MTQTEFGVSNYYPSNDRSLKTHMRYMSAPGGDAQNGAVGRYQVGSDDRDRNIADLMTDESGRAHYVARGKDGRFLRFLEPIINTVDIDNVGGKPRILRMNGTALTLGNLFQGQGQNFQIMLESAPLESACYHVGSYSDEVGIRLIYSAGDLETYDLLLDGPLVVGRVRNPDLAKRANLKIEVNWNRHEPNHLYIQCDLSNQHMWWYGFTYLLVRE